MLNLLPPEKKQEIKREFRWQRLLSFEEMLIFALLILVGVLVATWLYAFIQYRALADSANRVQASPQGQKIQDLEGKIKEMNIKLKYLEELNLQQTLNSEIIEEMIKSMPQDITLKTIALNRLTAQGSVSGWAPTREGLLRFKKNLESSSYFQQIELPLTSLLKDRDLDFNLNFSLK